MEALNSLVTLYDAVGEEGQGAAQRARTAAGPDGESAEPHRSIAPLGRAPRCTVCRMTPAPRSAGSSCCRRFPTIAKSVTSWRRFTASAATSPPSIAR